MMAWYLDALQSIIRTPAMGRFIRLHSQTARDLYVSFVDLLASIDLEYIKVSRPGSIVAVRCRSRALTSPLLGPRARPGPWGRGPVSFLPSLGAAWDLSARSAAMSTRRPDAKASFLALFTVSEAYLICCPPTDQATPTTQRLWSRSPSR